MKAAKFILCCVIAALIFSAPLKASGQRWAAYAAAPRYARADEEEIYFCKEKNSTALFAIPLTYHVEILSSDGEWYYVRYGLENDAYEPLYGYCKAEKLTPVEQTPEHIYLSHMVPLVFRTDAPTQSLPASNELVVTAAYYGSYKLGEFYYSYVRYGGKFYYTEGKNDDYEKFFPADDVFNETQQPETKSTNTKLIVGLVLAGVAVAAIIILYFTSRRSRYFKP